MKIDAGTIWGFAAVSLLTGTVECTQPTELEEIDMRADDIKDMLGDVELVYADNSYFPFFPDGKWPFATEQDAMAQRALEFAQRFPNVSSKEYDDLDIDTLIEILKKEEIEQKYRLSIVKKNVMRKVLVPF